jgi:UDP-2,3-diacylglucosamine hydrolase
LPAAAHWRQVELVSDLHLQPIDPATTAAFEHYLAHSQADALLVLGDLFEVWIGDDALDPAPEGAPPDPDRAWAQRCALALRRASDRRPVYVMRGNRDFLLGAGFAQATGCTLLDDPCVLDWGAHRWLLSHGDAWCLDDTDYLAFRAQVRQASWQAAFLAQAWPARMALARQLRERSEQRKAQTLAQGEAFADVDAACARDWLRQTGCQTLIHGHTHRPAEHALGDGLQRWVLSDWDANACPPRLSILRLDANGQGHRTPWPPCA